MMGSFLCLFFLSLLPSHPCRITLKLVQFVELKSDQLPIFAVHISPLILHHYARLSA